MSQIDGKVLDEISALLETPDYLTIFGALVSRSIDARSCDAIVSWARANATGLASRCDDDLDSYVRREEAAMRERIRAYVEQQEALFSLRKAQVGRTKAVLTRLAQEVAQCSDVPARFVASSTERRPGNDETNSSAADDEELFELDGFESSGRQGDESDADRNEDVSYSRSMDSHVTAPDSELGTSLPISMPGFANNWRRKSEEGAVADAETCQFENMGESMKKIAQSVHESSTKMFGDLPRPRVNSDAVRRFPRNPGFLKNVFFGFSAMKSLWRRLPKSIAERVATGFVFVAVPIIYLFEIVHIFPTVHPDPAPRLVHSIVFTLVVGQVVANYLKLLVEDSTVRRVVLPSVGKPGWLFCPFCQINAPPRATHCHMCSTCVLRRDHHCYFSASCVGFYNHRYFFLFVFYMVLGCFYCIVQNTEYILDLVDHVTITTIICMLFPLFTFVLPVDSHVTTLTLFFYSVCVISFLMTLILLGYQLVQIVRGQTGREYNTSNFDYDRKSIAKNLRLILGKYWYWTWLGPWVRSPLDGDGTDFSANEDEKQI